MSGGAGPATTTASRLRQERRGAQGGGSQRPRSSSPAIRRTLLATLAAALGVVPLKGLFSDNVWLLDAWLTMLVVIAPALLLRRRRPPGALDIWPGIVLLIPWLTLVFLPGTAVLGLIPTAETFQQVGALMTQLHHTTREAVAPIHTDVAVRLVVCALVGLLVALVDLIAVVGRRAALAGVPLLVVFTVSGAVPRQPVSWYWFLIAATGFLVLLSLDSGDDLRRWGRRVRTGADARRGAGPQLGPTVPRIAAVALVAAVVLPLLLPGDPRNLLADAFHGQDGTNGVSSFGGDGNGTISPFAALKGQLSRSNSRVLARVHMLGPVLANPFYLRVNTLTRYTDTGWEVGPREPGIDLATANGVFPRAGGGSPRSVAMQAQISITGMRGNPPVFAHPTLIQGLPSSTTWHPASELLLTTSIDDNTRFTEQFAQPAPSASQLDQASARIDPAVRSDLTVPHDVAPSVRSLVERTVGGASTQYRKARRLLEYFTDPAHGFTYSLQTKVGDSGNDLVDFLHNRRGFCQQYAAALGIMLRIAGVPSRVVLGYMHATPGRDKNFTVGTADAHSWVEAWFAGVGWVPFDPTPAAGLAPGAADGLPWAPHPQGNGSAASQDPRVSLPPKTTTSATADTSAAAPAQQGAGPSRSGAPVSRSLGWLVPLGLVVLVLALAATPAAIREQRRRRRYAAGRHGGTDPLWAELSTPRPTSATPGPRRDHRARWPAGWAARAAACHGA